MDRIFYYDGKHITVFHWAGEKMLSSYRFMGDTTGQNLFRQYLLASSQAPVWILMDVREEDYLQESIPHVAAKDRKRIINRRLKRQYPQSEGWCCIQSLGRESEKSSNDRIICNVQTKPKDMRPWLDIIDETGLLIGGLWNLSFLSEKLMSLLAIKDRFCVLVTQQSATKIRFSFLKDGDLYTSRIGVLDTDSKTIEENVAEELEGIGNYLINQRFINYNDFLAVHIIYPSLQINQLKRHIRDSVSRKYYYHKLEKIGEITGCIVNDYCIGIFASICRKQASIKERTGPEDIFRPYQRQIYAHYIRVTSIMIFVLACFLFIYGLSEIKLLEDKTNISQQQTLAVESIYQKRMASMQEPLSMAVPMKSAVAFSRRLKQSIGVSPGKAILQISRILSKHDDMKISSMAINKVQQSYFPDSSLDKIKASWYSKDTDVQYIKLQGYIDGSEIQSENIIDNFNRIRKALESEKDIVDINFIRWPMDADRKVNRMLEPGRIDSYKTSIQNTFEIAFLINGDRG